MGHYLILIYGIIAYAVGLGGLAYFAVFMGGWSFLPLHIDSRSAGPSVTQPLLINFGLIVLFGLQHSVMARQSWKDTLTRWIPRAAERSTYVFVSGVVVLAMCYLWQPMKGELWHTDHQVPRLVLTAVQLLGWTLAVSATFLINHWELMGLQQVYLHFQSKPEPEVTFTEQSLYRFVRHPLQLGLLIGMWTTPTMSMTHLAFSTGMTVYIFAGLYFEEKDLVATLGEDYQDYRRRVPMLLPLPWGQKH